MQVILSIRQYHSSSLITRFVLLLLIVFAGNAGIAQQLQWWNPAKSTFPVIEGQSWPAEIQHFYDRLPGRAEMLVRKEVWSLSRNAAGLKIRFKTDARQISVRYVVEKKKYAMDHFPATGVSGIDLYSPNKDGSWAWANGKYKFGDTISYRFSNLDLDTRNYKNGREYQLYLPLYNTVSWLEIGVPQQASFIPLPARKDKPIVVYGTSIAQGGCASRPGMAWPAMLERRLGIPVVNLGFSGNGQLENEVINLINEIDARVFILDCLPNLGGFNAEEVEKRIIASVNTLRKKHPQTPILLTEHSGFIENRMDAARRHSIAATNAASEQAFNKLIAAGIKNLYRLPAKEVSMGTDGTVDGTHPTDLGMIRYANAYEKIIRKILKSIK